MIEHQALTKAAKRSWQMKNATWLLVLLLAFWESLAQLGAVNINFLPPPSTLAVTAWEQARSGTLFTNSASSLTRVVAGFIIATLLGVGGGLALCAFPFIGRRVVLLLDLLRPIPPIAWIPIAILWFGLGSRPTIFIVAVGAFFPIFLSTYHGVRSVNQAYVNVARCLGARSRLIMTDILFPAALPQILTGLRVGVGTAWTSVIAAEMVGTCEGLGYAIQLNRTMLETEAVMVNMVVIGLIGWVMSQLIGQLEKHLTRWNQGTLVAHQADTEV